MRYGRKLVVTAALAASLSAPQAVFAKPASGARQETIYRGRCEYAPKYAELLERGSHSFAICDVVELSREDGWSIVDFRRDGDDLSFRFAGEWDGGTMQVERLSVRRGEFFEASGECEIFRRGGEPSVITCIAWDAPTSYIANFVRDPLG